MDYITILPEDLDLTTQHTYLRLPHPRTGQPQLYLPVASARGERILEVVKVNGAKRRTWFIDSSIDAGTMLIHHPIDLLFLVIPLLLPLTRAESGNTTPFQPLSSLFSTISASSAHSLVAPFTRDKTPTSVWNEDVEKLLSFKSIRRVFKLCCERKIVPHGPPSPKSLNSSSSTGTTPSHSTYYRPSLDATVRLLRSKVEWFAEEERWGSFDHNLRQLAREGLLAKGTNPGLVKEARLKSSIDHFAQYLSPSILTLLLKSYDFSAYETHLANLSAATLAASMPPTNLPGKTEKTAAGTKRKSTSSRGVEALKKVNTTSMNKLTSFFKPKEKS